MTATEERAYAGAKLHGFVLAMMDCGIIPAHHLDAAKRLTTEFQETFDKSKVKS